MKRTALLLACASLLGLSSGCVTGTRSLGVNVAPSETPLASPTRGALAIGQINDQRTFQNHPDDPSTPSIDGDVTQLSPAAKSTYIGRQRNTWGHAMGDIALPNGQTVQGKVSELLAEGLRRRGYSIVGTDKTDNRVSADVQQFWSWMTPGFFALSFEVRIQSTVVITKDGKSSTLTVSGYGLNHGQFAKDSNWSEAFDIAFSDYLKNLDDQLSKAGL